MAFPVARVHPHRALTCGLEWRTPCETTLNENLLAAAMRHLAISGSEKKISEYRRAECPDETCVLTPYAVRPQRTRIAAGWAAWRIASRSQAWRGSGVNLGCQTIKK